MSSIALKHIACAYGDVRVLDGFDLELEDGSFHTLLGPSGCGKTTTLRLVAGFLSPKSGTIEMDGIDITHLPPNKRSMGIVFQNYALFPHLNVFDNVAYGLKMNGIAKDERAKIVDEQLELVGMAGLEKREIGELSGGQQQRVALARALAPSPKVLLLDEPMSNLDVTLRQKMRIELRHIQQTVGITTLFITHDQQEALSISDTVSVMDGGVIVQNGAPREIYEHPANDFVADFVGTTNHLDAAATPWNTTETAIDVRPERLRIHRSQDAPNLLEGRITEVVYLGSTIDCGVETTAGNCRVTTLNDDGTGVISVGDQVFLELVR